MILPHGYDSMPTGDPSEGRFSEFLHPAALRTEARAKLRAAVFAVLEGALLRRNARADTAFTDTDRFVTAPDFTLDRRKRVWRFMGRGCVGLGTG
ncbi:hypothetical protein [Embleya sp. MST-111070]|uniref:hypothetical protein n=1 Tax=Embleya sp. MST-111070 TaxID=3398231 RepID=UPI003F739ACA